MRLASAARRPLTQAVSPYLSAQSTSAWRIGSATWASPAWRTIGASVPSMSLRIAVLAGSRRSGAIAGARSAAGGTAPSMARMLSRRTLALAATGTAAGVFSGMFGVGGGSVMVPLLILWLGFGPREATGTSLAAIVVIATVAAGTQALYGNVHWGDAALIGLPAVAGVLFGTWLQQRVPVRAVELLFAGVLVVTAVHLVLQ